VNKIILYISIILLYPTIIFSGKNNIRKKQNPVRYGIIKSDEGFSFLFTGALTTDQKNKLQTTLTTIAHIDEQLQQCKKGSPLILELKQQITDIETAHNLQRLPDEKYT
jgi:hypothetical protein